MKLVNYEDTAITPLCVVKLKYAKTNERFCPKDFGSAGFGQHS